MNRSFINKIINFFAFNIPIYRDIFCKVGGVIVSFTGLDSLKAESVFRGMTLSSLSLGKRIIIGRGVIICKGKGVVQLGEDVIINHYCYLVADRIGGYIKLGNKSHLDAHVVLHGQGGISIGQKCAIASGVIIYSQTNQYKFNELNVVDQPIVFSEVNINDGVWIGANATILPGITIGKNSIVGAGALVNKDIPDDSIALGVPIKIYKK